MIKLFFIILLNLIGFNINAQNSDTVISIVHYTFLHQRDTLNKEYYKEDMSLFFSKFSTVYKSLTGERNDSILKAKIEQQIKDGLSVNLGHISSNYTKQNYYCFFRKGMAEVESPFLSNKYLFSDTLPEIKWKIKDTFKIFSGLKCQLANGYFAGRLYEVWFCPDIPITAGPWKLWGLPGLILEGYDSKQQVKFIFAGISKNINSSNTITLPKDAIRTTRAEFKKMVTAFNENPNSFNNSSGVNFKVEKAPGTIKKSNFNNPLEIVKSP